MNRSRETYFDLPGPTLEMRRGLDWSVYGPSAVASVAGTSVVHPLNITAPHTWTALALHHFDCAYI
jgi:hypothetical protein